MNGGVNWYRADLRELHFVLFEQFGFGEIAGQPPFEGWGPDETKAVLEETYRFAREELGTLNSSGDREGCRLEEGQVHTPKGFKEAWRKLYETGFKSVSVRPEHGGQGAPRTLQLLIEELLSGANTAFNMYPGLAFGASELIAECGTPAQVRKYVEKMFNGIWGGTMCLTEPQAGSDVGAARTSAEEARTAPTESAGRRFSSPAAITIWPKISSTWCSRAWRTRRPGRKAYRCSSSPRKRSIPM